MRYILKERVLFEVFKKQVKNLADCVDDMYNIPTNHLIREVSMVTIVANIVGVVVIRENIVPIGNHCKTVSGFNKSIDTETANKLVDELELAVDALECQYKW